MYSNDVQVYLDSWLKFKFCCEHRAKIADCHINAKGWQKLKEYHLEDFLKRVENPYGFLFRIRLRHRSVYRDVHCMAKLFHKYSRLRQKEMEDNSTRKYVVFPSWRNRHEKSR